MIQDIEKSKTNKTQLNQTKMETYMNRYIDIEILLKKSQKKLIEMVRRYGQSSEDKNDIRIGINNRIDVRNGSRAATTNLKCTFSL